jgi:hypothetical protein
MAATIYVIKEGAARWRLEIEAHLPVLEEVLR